jgi:tRNA pseudouridine38-40 synthase
LPRGDARDKAGQQKDQRLDFDVPSSGLTLRFDRRLRQACYPEILTRVIYVRNAKLIIKYDGTNYHGWQIQAIGPTIQGEITRVISMLEQRPVTVHGAGRTDAGVHAEGQVANLLVAGDFEPAELRGAINGHLNDDIRVWSVEFVDDGFHARLSAKRKKYRYDIATGAVVSPFLCRYAYHYRSPLDTTRMQQAADLLIGKHDFIAFAGGKSDSDSTVRTLYSLDIQSKDDRVSINACGSGFLKYMVRTIAGTLLDVGRGRRDPEDMPEILASRDRGRASKTAPAAGLTLVQVDY